MIYFYRGGRRNGKMKLLKEYIKDRDDAVLSLDLDKFKAFAKKWIDKGLLPNSFINCSDEVIKSTMCKIVLGLKDAPEDKVEAAKTWLIDNGYRPNI